MTEKNAYDALMCVVKISVFWKRQLQFGILETWQINLRSSNRVSFCDNYDQSETKIQ